MTGRDQTCTIHDHSAPVREDFIDFPTGWRIQCEGLTHIDLRCSALQTDGAMLCDCGAVEVEWNRRVFAQAAADARCPRCNLNAPNVCTCLTTCGHAECAGSTDHASSQT